MRMKFPVQKIIEWSLTMLDLTLYKQSIDYKFVALTTKLRRSPGTSVVVVVSNQERNVVAFCCF